MRTNVASWRLSRFRRAGAVNKHGSPNANPSPNFCADLKVPDFDTRWIGEIFDDHGDSEYKPLDSESIRLMQEMFLTNPAPDN
jgi:hypothetical protein